MNKKTTGCIWVILGMILCFSLLMNLALVGGRVKDKAAVATASSRGSTQGFERLNQRVIQPGAGEKKIVRIGLNGMISSSINGRIGRSMVDDLRIQLRQAASDSNVAAIVLAIDSPGGEVTASDIIYKAVAEAREQKPVVISMGSMATSGGYYAAMGGSWIFAHETTFTGSIGVIIQTFRYKDMLGKIGVQPETFKSGAFKDMLSGTRDMTGEERDYVQRLVMQTYGIFVGIVAKERKLPEEELRNGVADGRVVSGKDALEAKLIDEIGGIEAAYAKAGELAKVEDAPVVEYEEQFRIARLFRLFGSEAKGHVEVKLPVPAVLPELEPGKAYLLPGICVP